MPVLNEERYLERAVQAIFHQDYPGPLEVCLALGPSTDRTDDVAARLQGAEPRLRTVANPTGRTPAGLNAAIRATSGDIVVRVDGHAVLPPGYITRAVSTLQRTGAVNVGGVQLAEGTTPFEKAVALAMSSPFGMGGAKFHSGGAEGPVDTVYLGVFRRAAIEAVGLFDETLARNQDYELNIRLRKSGGTVWFDPALHVTYRPRPTLRALARQYAEYGAWKR
ncbi:MAG: Poly-beta,6-N-acetyl-D-glucosamine synthase, partial [Actinomycetota bacterium]